MILSICLATFLPFLAYSWHHHGGPPLLFTPDLPLVPPPPQPTPPPPPPSYSSVTHQRRLPKLGNLWMMEKGKRTATITADVTSSPNPSVNQASWVTQEHQERRFLGGREDYFLETQVNAPSGTQLTWYKDNNQLLRQGSSTSSGSSYSSSSSSSSLLRISSAVYIDCAGVDDAGFYRLEVQTPGNGQVLHRNFTVIVIDGLGEDGVTCSVDEVTMRYVPRIYQYAIYTRANVGDRTVLPCRYQGLLTSSAWYRNNSIILPQDTNHEKLANGDLVIRQLSGSSGPQEYACRVASTQYAIDADIIRTAVYAQGNSAAVNTLS